MSSVNSVADVKQRLGALLLDAGFTGRDLEWVRVRNPFIDCVDMQLRSDAAAYCVNLGEHLSFLPAAGGSAPIDAENMSSVDCEIKSRLTPHGESEYWWKIGCESSVDEIVRCFNKSGEEFFHQYRNFPKPFSDIDMSMIDSEAALKLMPTMTKVRRILVIARVHDHLCDASNAIAWAEFGYQNVGVAVSLKAAFREILLKHK